jgi:hypothetical protein
MSRLYNARKALREVLPRDLAGGAPEETRREPAR